MFALCNEGGIFLSSWYKFYTESLKNCNFQDDFVDIEKTKCIEIDSCSVLILRGVGFKCIWSSIEENFPGSSHGCDNPDLDYLLKSSVRDPKKGYYIASICEDSTLNEFLIFLLFNYKRTGNLSFLGDDFSEFICKGSLYDNLLYPKLCLEKRKITIKWESLFLL